MFWVLIAHPDQYLEGRLLQTPDLIPETAVPIAVAQGWIVVARDRDLAPVNIDVNLHSNPHRTKERP